MSKLHLPTNAITFKFSQAKVLSKITLSSINDNQYYASIIEYRKAFEDQRTSTSRRRNKMIRKVHKVHMRKK